MCLNCIESTRKKNIICTEWSTPYSYNVSRVTISIVTETVWVHFTHPLQHNHKTILSFWENFSPISSDRFVFGGVEFREDTVKPDKLI